MTSIHTQRDNKNGEGSFLPWVLLAATTTAVVVVRHRVQRRRREDALIDSEAREQHDEDVSELSNPLPEDQDLMKEKTVDLLPGKSMLPYQEVQKVDDHSKDGTAETFSSLQSETFEI